MSEAKWSPEPWSYDPDGRGGRSAMVRAGDAVIVAVRHRLPDTENEHNMRRIAACVNACAGIPTEALESGALTVALNEFVDLMQEIDTTDAEPDSPNGIALAALRALGRLK